MKVAVYSLTRDRLDYTQYCFDLLEKKAGYPYHHFIVDNGSTDGTVDWLEKYIEKDNVDATFLPENKGISAGSNLAIDWMFQEYDPDIVIKMDNDCEIVSDFIIAKVVEFCSYMKGNFVISPRVTGINRQPSRNNETYIGGIRFGRTSIVGGLFQVTPRTLYTKMKFRYDETLPKAWGQDDVLCSMMCSYGLPVGYIEDLVVSHYKTTSGQAEEKPEYFERKFKEEGKRSL